MIDFGEHNERVFPLEFAVVIVVVLVVIVVVAARLSRNFTGSLNRE